MNLNDIVNSALAELKEGKVASEYYDSTHFDLLESLSLTSPSEGSEQSKSASAVPPQSPAPAVPANVADALKVASALEVAAAFVAEMAGSVKRAGLTVTQAADPGKGSPAAPPVKAGVPAKYEVGGAGKQGPNGHVADSEGDTVATTPLLRDKKAAQRLFDAKMADAQVAERLGNKEAAAQIRNSALQVAKIAGLEVSEGSASPTPGPSVAFDALRNLTPRKAQEQNLSDGVGIAPFITETQKVDPLPNAALGAGSDAGIKKAAPTYKDIIRSRVDKGGVLGDDEASLDADDAYDEGVRRDTEITGPRIPGLVIGGLTGAGLGHMIGGRTGALLGGALGTAAVSSYRQNAAEVAHGRALEKALKARLAAMPQKTASLREFYAAKLVANGGA